MRIPNTPYALQVSTSSSSAMEAIFYIFNQYQRVFSLPLYHLRSGIRWSLHSSDLNVMFTIQNILSSPTSTCEEEDPTKSWILLSIRIRSNKKN